MRLFDKLDKSISRQNWDHLQFLKMITIIIVLNLLIFFTWIFIMANNGLVDKAYFDRSVKQLSISILFGGISGLLIGFIELIPFYISKQFDLHIVVPKYLFMYLISLITVILLSSFIINNNLEQYGFDTGFSLGGLIAIIAYAGEVKKEHNKEDELLIE